MSGEAVVPPPRAAPSWLRALGLHRRELRAWALYDWASSAFATTIMASVLQIYYGRVAAATIPPHLRTAYWGYTLTVAAVIVAVISPVLGATADYLAARKRFLASFAALGVLGTLLLCFAGEGDWLLASCAFVLGNVGFAAGNVFYESMLPHVARPDEIDRVSTAGYAIGYVGGGLLLAINLLWIVAPQRFGLADAAQASRLSFASVAVWWAAFTVPLLRRVPEPARRLEAREVLRMSPVRAGFSRVAETFRDLRRHREVFVFLVAFWFYNDGIITIAEMATIYATELGIGQGALLGALVLVQFLGIPFTFAYGLLAERIGAKKCVGLALAVYTAISILGYSMTAAWHFWVLAAAVATVQGGTQALSRSLYATMVPPGKSSEFFGFYSVSSRLGSIAGPFAFALVSQLTANSRLGVLALVVFFLIGMLLLGLVDVEKGRQAARVEDESLRLARERR